MRATRGQCGYGPSRGLSPGALVVHPGLAELRAAERAVRPGDGTTGRTAGAPTWGIDPGAPGRRVCERAKRVQERLAIFDSAEHRRTGRNWLRHDRAWLERLGIYHLSEQRRARAMDLGPPAQVGPDLGIPLPEGAWILPIPDDRALAAAADAADPAAKRDTIRLAFVAALQRLPPRQRVVLILGDVLCWKSDEVARLLATTVASVTSTLQRARTTLKNVHITPAEPFEPMDQRQQQLLARYCQAFERYV